MGSKDGYTSTRRPKEKLVVRELQLELGLDHPMEKEYSCVPVRFDQRKCNQSL